MPRAKEKNTEKDMKNISIYKQAYEEVQKGLLSNWEAATIFELCHVPLIRYKKKREEVVQIGENLPVTVGYRAWNEVFYMAQERAMVDYIVSAAQILWFVSEKDQTAGLWENKIYQCLSVGRKEVSKWGLVYQLHERAPITFKKVCATYQFPPRVTSFNETNISKFCDNLARVMNRYQF